MELAEGCLDDELRAAQAQGQAGIEPRALVRDFGQAAAAFDYLRRVGLAHCDVKGANLLRVGPVLKVSDFGLLQPLGGPCRAGYTPAYAAPEQINGWPSGQTDQYALAVTWCELRGGRLPFAGNDLNALLDGHKHRQPDLSMLPARERLPVARALSKAPEGRWRSCGEFVRALRAAARS
jgi:serine/threonine-protein kinase